MLSALPEDYIAIMVPAMPQSKRIVVGGYSVIDLLGAALAHAGRAGRPDAGEAVASAHPGWRASAPYRSAMCRSVR